MPPGQLECSHSSLSKSVLNRVLYNLGVSMFPSVIALGSLPNIFSTGWVHSWTHKLTE